MCLITIGISGMEKAQIEQMIATQLADPHAVVDLQELLLVVAEREGANPNAAELARGASFVCNYIEQVPYLLTVAWTSARNVGLEAEMDIILEMVQAYWFEDNDVIPDKLGIIGLLDDAYCTLVCLQTLSDLYQMQSGKYLFPDNLTTANSILRKIIGEPYATELDGIVNNTVMSAQVKEAVKLLASPEKQRLFAHQANIWNHEPASELLLTQLSGLGLTDDL